jgi:O-antigen ligase
MMRNRAVAWRFAWLVIVMSPLALALLLSSTDFLDPIVQKLEAALNTNDQASTRLMLSVAGIESISSSWLSGYGPGAFSLPNDEGIRQEAHNTLVDWGTQAGIGALVVIVVMAFQVVRHLLRIRRPWMAAAVVALLDFSALHFVFRQPVFWILFLLPTLLLARERNYLSAAGTRGPGATSPSSREAVP